MDRRSEEYKALKEERADALWKVSGLSLLTLEVAFASRASSRHLLVGMHAPAALLYCRRYWLCVPRL